MKIIKTTVNLSKCADGDIKKGVFDVISKTEEPMVSPEEALDSWRIIEDRVRCDKL